MPELLTRRAVHIGITRSLSIKNTTNTLIPTPGKKVPCTMTARGGRVGGIGWSNNRQSESLRRQWVFRKADLHSLLTRREHMSSSSKEAKRVGSRSFPHRGMAMEELSGIAARVSVDRLPGNRWHLPLDGAPCPLTWRARIS